MNSHNFDVLVRVQKGFSILADDNTTIILKIKFNLISTKWTVNHHVKSITMVGGDFTETRETVSFVVAFARETRQICTVTRFATDRTVRGNVNIMYNFIQ